MYFRIAIILTLAFLVGSFAGCSGKSNKVETDVVLKTQLDSVAYTIGMNLGANLRNDSLIIDVNILAAALQTALKGDSTLLTEAQTQEVMKQFQQTLAAKQQEKAQRDGAVNKAKGDKFLAENKTKPGVQTTASGLQYIVMKEGTGAKPKADQIVKCHYHGTFLDGKVFDSSIDRGQPVEFPLNKVIPGWTEGLQLMKIGAKYKFYIPGELAYGLRGAPPQIGPNETLVFDVELIEIKDAPTPAK